MLKKISIQNYKSAQNLSIDLGQVNVFIGENGCGKTNILEAIAMGGAATENKLDNEFLVTRGIRTTEANMMVSRFDKEANIGKDILIGFEDEDNEYLQTTLFCSNDKWHGQIKIDESLSVSFSLSVESVKNAFRNFGVYDMTRETSLENKKQFIATNHLSPFLIYAPENYFLRRFEEEGQIRPLGIRGEGLFKHLLDLFKQQPEVLQEIKTRLKLIDWFDDLAIPKDLYFGEKRINIRDKFLPDDLTEFDQRSANEGFLYLLFYFTLFISPKTPQFFAIDNIDNALNPKLCTKLTSNLVDLAKTHQKQVILTTHNPAILDGLDLTDDNQRLFVIYRNAEGHTTTKRIMPPNDIQGVPSVRLSEAFIRGYLGGLPKNF